MTQDVLQGSNYRPQGAPWDGGLQRATPVGIEMWDGERYVRIEGTSVAYLVSEAEIVALLAETTEGSEQFGEVERRPDPEKVQARTPTPVPSLRSRRSKRYIYEALWSWVHQGAVYRTFTIAEALEAVLQAPKVQEQYAPFAGTEMELVLREAIQTAIKVKLDQALWNAHGVRSFYAVPQPDQTWRWVHIRGLTKTMVERLIADVDSNIRTLRDKRHVFDTFLQALNKRDGAILDDVYVEVRDALGWEE